MISSIFSRKIGIYSISVKSPHGIIKSTQNERNEAVNEVNSNVIENISIISLSSQKNMNQNQKNVINEDNETFFKCICKIAIFMIGTVGLSVFAVVPWTTIPRTNSIIFQSSWMEILLPSAWGCILYAGCELLHLTIWTQERSLISLNTLMKITLVYVASLAMIHILSRMIWCVYLGYNHPLPFLGSIQMAARFVSIIALRFLIPSKLTANEDYRKKLRVYTYYYLWIIVTIFKREALNYLFINIKETFQFLVAFMIAACREFDKKVRTNLVTKIMGTLDEPGSVLVSISVSIAYSSFLATRIAGATGATVFCMVTIDFLLHSRMTLQIIKEHNKVKEDDTKYGTNPNNTKTTKLILAELVEGFTPMTFAICMIMAYYGPNAELFVNIGSNFWGKPIEDINYVFGMMAVLYTVDTISAAINSIIVWKVTKINMLQEYCKVLSKYWIFMVIKLSYLISVYFASKDVNFGIDSSGKFKWITPEGRLDLIQNATYRNEEEISMSIANCTFV